MTTELGYLHETLADQQNLTPQFARIPTTLANRADGSADSASHYRPLELHADARSINFSIRKPRIIETGSRFSTSVRRQIAGDPQNLLPREKFSRGTPDCHGATTFPKPALVRPVIQRLPRFTSYVRKERCDVLKHAASGLLDVGKRFEL